MISAGAIEPRQLTEAARAWERGEGTGPNNIFRPYTATQIASSPDRYIALLRTNSQLLPEDSGATVAQVANFETAQRPPSDLKVDPFWMIWRGECVGRVVTRVPTHAPKWEGKPEGVWTGHVNIDVRPDARGQGLGLAGLELGIHQMQATGLKEVMVSCSASNGVSEHNIVKTGGRLAHTDRAADGQASWKYYRVDLLDWRPRSPFLARTPTIKPVAAQQAKL